MLELTGCPECGRPAEITDRFALASTDGPVEHVVVLCTAGHRFRMPAAGLPSDPVSAAAAHRRDRRVPPAAGRARRSRRAE